jgi:hypothetical protein
VCETRSGLRPSPSSVRSLDQVNLLQKAAEALRLARRLPVGAERNELRQVALGLRWMAIRELKIKREDENPISSFAGSR